MHGDITSLQSATQTSFVFAKRVLQAISDGTEDSPLKRDVRNDYIKCTQWPDEISTFIFQSENSRAMPGKDSVSIRYGVRRPKFLLLTQMLGAWPSVSGQHFEDLNPQFHSHAVAWQAWQPALCVLMKRMSHLHGENRVCLVTVLNVLKQM